MKAFSEFSDKEIKKYISEANKEHKEDFDQNTKFLKGDHWQDGKGWAGALPESGNERSSAIQKISTLFTSQNVIKEVARRHIAAVIGKEPEWSVGVKRGVSEDEPLSESEKEDITEIEAALTEWWKEQEIHDELKEWTKAILKGSRAVLRIYIPNGFISDNGTIETGGELPEQLNKIRVEMVEPDKGAVVTNKDQSTEAGIISFKDDDDNEIYEISYLNENEETIIKNITEGTEPDALNLNGHLSIYEGDRDLFLSKQIRQQNKLLNKAITMMSNNVDSGFLERIFTNAQPPGEWKTDENGKEYFEPAPYQVGPGTTNFVNPPTIEDEEGKAQALGNAGVTFREPVTNSSFSEAKAEAYEAVLQESHQLHALITGDATASGESRIQALTDFILSVQDTKSTIDKAGVWLLETVMYLAFDLSGNTSGVEEYNATFNCRIDPGNIPADLRNAILNQVEEGLLSRETAMAMLGVDDIDAELAKIDSAAEKSLDIMVRLRDANINSKTLTQRLVGVVIEDKEFISEALEDGDLETINSEIEAEMDRRTQEGDAFSALGIPQS